MGLRSFLISAMDIITETTLPNGIPLIHIHRPHSRAEYTGVMIDAGARDETPGTFGLAHFVEHTIFKGTTTRSSLDILCTMEEIGGELNAYTTKEETVVYTAAPSGNSRRSMTLISDLLSNAVFLPRELTKERQVVAEEIESYRDMPAELIFDEFENLLFKNSQLGHNILGTVTRLRKFTSAVCRDYVSTHFRASRMAAVYMGPCPSDEIAGIAAESLGMIPGGNENDKSEARVAPQPTPRFSRIRKADSHQAHTVLGTTAPSLHDPRRRAWILMTNILGGPGMNSLLNIALRENLGLAYTVEANMTSLTDTGLFTIYFGCDTRDTQRCIKAAADVIDRLASATSGDDLIAKAKHQLAGQMLLGSESALDYALSILKSRLRFGRPLTLEDRIAAIGQVTAHELSEAAGSVRLDCLSSLTLL